MQKEYKKIDINKIDTLQDEMEEMLDMNNEIQEAMSRQYDTPDVSYTWSKIHIYIYICLIKLEGI